MKRALVMLVAGTLVSGVAAWTASAADPAPGATLSRDLPPAVASLRTPAVTTAATD